MSGRILEHPILTVLERRRISFSFNGRAVSGLEGDVISSALVAGGIDTFGHHVKDGSAQGLFCANGQCSQCLVMADGLPVKACMTALVEGMVIESVEGLPSLPADDRVPQPSRPEMREVEVLVLGGGPAGLAAALELGAAGVQTLLVDDKHELGGKLVLQTHKFFGSEADSQAGTRGFLIGRRLAAQIRQLPTVEVWPDTTAVGVFSDGMVGVVREGAYRLIRPQVLLVATGARERMISFPGNTLPGVYGAGAFQTLVNRDLVACATRLLIVGGGNVGLISGYHALQAGIEVAALVEALPAVGGYKVHEDKLRRLGVPILTSHTITSAVGAEHVERVIIAALDETGCVRAGSERTYAVDAVLIAVGLTKVEEFYLKAEEAGIPVFCAGDADEIAEASAAMMGGKIEGVRIAGLLGRSVGRTTDAWQENLEILRSKPGSLHAARASDHAGQVEPIFHCLQEIPCNPCASVCPEGVIATEGGLITGVPYVAAGGVCRACLRCVRICPGLAIVLVDARGDQDFPLLTLPYELARGEMQAGFQGVACAIDGEDLGLYPVEKVLPATKKYPGTALVQIRVPQELAHRVAGVRAAGSLAATPLELGSAGAWTEEAIVCRCERVSEQEIRMAIRSGVHDLNQLKVLTRTGMGACGGKTCRPQLARLLREEGVDASEVTLMTERPLFVEVPLGVLAGVRPEGGGRS